MKSLLGCLQNKRDVFHVPTNRDGANTQAVLVRRLQDEADRPELASHVDPALAAHERGARDVQAIAASRDSIGVRAVVEREKPVIHHFLQVSPAASDYVPDDEHTRMSTSVMLSQLETLNSLIRIKPDVVYTSSESSSKKQLRLLQGPINEHFQAYVPGQRLTHIQQLLLTETAAADIYGVLRTKPPRVILSKDEQQMRREAAARIEAFYERNSAVDGTGFATIEEQQTAIRQLDADEQIILEFHDQLVAKNILDELADGGAGTHADHGASSRAAAPADQARKIALVSAFFHDLVPYVDPEVAEVSEHDHASRFLPKDYRDILVKRRDGHRAYVLKQKLQTA